MILEKLKNRISSDGMLLLVSQSERSQLANKRKVTERFDQLIQQALKKKRTRIPTGVSAAQKQLRLESKKRHAEKKKQRRIRHDE
jgi:ribosome-associated protein